MIDDAYFRRFFEEEIPFNAALGLRIAKVASGHVTIRLPFRDEHVGDIFRPAMHGGVLAALIDSAAGAAAFTLAEPQDRISTIDLRVDFLRPAPKQDLVAVADVRRMGNRTAVVNVLVSPATPQAEPEGEPVAEGRAVFSVRKNLGPMAMPLAD
jgi:uncharacterized protein (TIGR00369 family)